MKDRVIGVLLFLLVSTVYYATTVGMSSTNDGSHYALVRALSDEQRFEIDTYVDFTGRNDYSSNNGKFYTDRPPGTALIAVPFYLSGYVLPRPIAFLTQSAYDVENPRLVYTVMMIPLVAAAAVVLLYCLLRSYNLSVFASFTTSLAFAFGTIYWKYGSVMFSHALSGLLVLGSVALAVHIVRNRNMGWPTALLLGFILGYSVIVDYSNAILVVVILAYLALNLRLSLFRSRNWWTSTVALGMGIGIPLAFLMWYNTLNFGGPFINSYTHLANPAYHRLRQFGTTFAGSWAAGLPGLLWYGFDEAHVDNQGLFLLMPVTLVALPGFWPYFKRHRIEAALSLLVVVIYLFLFGRHIIFSDGTRDGRYLVPFLSLLFIPVAFALEEVHRLEPASFLRTIILFAVYGLIFLSIRNTVLHIGFSYSYHLDPNAMARTASIPSNWQYLFNSIFVNWRNVPLLWLVEAIAAGAAFGMMRILKRRSLPHAHKEATEEPSPAERTESLPIAE